MIIRAPLSQLNTLSSQLSALNEQHMAFPILHYYQAAREEKSPDVAIAILDDALNIIKLGMDQKNLLPKTILSSARHLVDSFLTTVKGAFIKFATETPQLPDLSVAREAGVPVISDEEFKKKMGNIKDRRKMILGVINSGSWKWSGEN